MSQSRKSAASDESGTPSSRPCDVGIDRVLHERDIGQPRAARLVVRRTGDVHRIVEQQREEHFDGLLPAGPRGDLVEPRDDFFEMRHIVIRPAWAAVCRTHRVDERAGYAERRGRLDAHDAGTASSNVTATARRSGAAEPGRMTPGAAALTR